jgi:hypothetical protein
MSKSSGLGDALWFGGYDISNDTNSVQKIACPTNMADTTGIDKLAHERLPLQRDGDLQCTVYFNKLGAHVPLSALPRTDTIATYAHGAALGGPAACINAKEIDYAPNRAADGSLLINVDAQANGFGLEWGVLLTPGKRTDAAATNGASLDGGAGFSTPAVPGSGVTATNTSPLPATVVVSAGTVTNVTVNGVSVGSGDGTYTVPPSGTIAVTYSVAPTWTWTLQSPYGLQAYLQVFAFTGTDATVKLQDSADNASFADVASAAFVQITTTTPQAQRIAISNAATVRRYVRAVTVTTGGFTSLTFAVMFNRNPVAGVAF